MSLTEGSARTGVGAKKAGGGGRERSLGYLLNFYFAQSRGGFFSLPVFRSVMVLRNINQKKKK